MTDRSKLADVAQADLLTAHEIADMLHGDSGATVSDVADVIARHRQASIAPYVEALTPSGETKAAYMSEFSVPLPELDEDGNEYVRRINVPWTTIKEIMATILKRAQIDALLPDTKGEG